MSCRSVFYMNLIPIVKPNLIIVIHEKFFEVIEELLHFTCSELYSVSVYDS